MEEIGGGSSHKSVVPVVLICDCDGTERRRNAGWWKKGKRKDQV